jgi:tRNA A-37 threonylcarbamoyl transferase component Bud32
MVMSGSTQMLKDESFGRSLKGDLLPQQKVPTTNMKNSCNSSNSHYARDPPSNTVTLKPPSKKTSYTLSTMSILAPTSLGVTTYDTASSKNTQNTTFSTAKTSFPSNTSNIFSSTEIPSEIGLSLPGYLKIDYATDVRQKSVISQGGFGIAYVADALTPPLQQFGTQIVVKVLKKPQMSAKDVQIFHLEVSLMEYFKKETNIAKILGYSEDPFAIAMKYYEHGSLRSWLVKRSGNVKSKNHLIAFTWDIASGLFALHKKGVIHNDLKPDNVLIDTDNFGRPFCVLTDFGIAQVVTENILQVKMFHVAEIRGLSLAYASPERIHSLRNGVSHGLISLSTVLSWDVYSLAVTLYELMNGIKQRLIYGKPPTVMANTKQLK